MSSPDDRSRSDLLLRLYPDTAESGETYDIDVLTKQVMSMKRVGSYSVSPDSSLGLLDTAESGDAYDAEVEESLGGELQDQSIPESGDWNVDMSPAGS